MAKNMYFHTKKTVSPITIVTLVFVVLKLFKVITWSWWWVFSPIIALWFVIGAIMWIGAKIKAWKYS